MRIFTKLFLFGSVLISPLSADERPVKPPRGFAAFAELEEVSQTAAGKKKFLAVAVKGYDDTCPKCSSALESGASAFRSQCEMVFVRVKDLRAAEDPPAALKEQIASILDGATMSFLIFSSDGSELIARIDRDELNDPKAVRETRKKVSAAAKD